MSQIMLIYWLFFIALFIFTLITWNKLSTASKKTEVPPELTSVESFLLWINPDFPVLSLAKILPGTFVGFGILGTFLGFASGISGINMSASSEEIFNSIGTLLNGMNTAFYTSIAGVVLSVFFSIAFQIPLHKIKSLIKNQPTVEEKQKESIVLSMQEYVNQVRELTENLISAKDSMESLPEKFNAVGTSLEESIAPVKETFGQMQNTLQSYAEQAKMMEGASSSIGETLKKFSETNEKITQNISKIFEKSEAMNKNIIEENQTLTQSHKTTLEEYKQLDENISTALEKLNANVAVFSTKVYETTKSIFENTVENFETALEKTQKSIVDTFLSENETLTKERKKDLEEYKQLDENISTALEKLNANVAQYSETMEKTLVETLENFTKAAQEVSGALLGS